MAIFVISQPQKVVNGKASNLLAALAQVPYNFKRVDYNIDIDSIQEGDFGGAGFPGAISFLIDNPADVSAEFPVGENIFLVSLDFEGQTTGTPYSIPPATYVVVNVIPGPPTRVFINNADGNLWPDAADDEGDPPGLGQINATAGRPSYRLEIQIGLETDPDANIFDRSFLFVPNQAGDLFVDLSGQMSSYLGENFLQDEVFIPSYRENWVGNLSPDGFIDLVDVHALRGRKPILAQGGANMGDFVLGAGSEGDAFPFDDPSLWDNTADGAKDWVFEAGQIVVTLDDLVDNSSNTAFSADPEIKISEGLYTVQAFIQIEITNPAVPTVIQVYLKTSVNQVLILEKSFSVQGSLTEIVTATIQVAEDDPVGVGFFVDKPVGTGQIRVVIKDAILADAPKQGKFLTEFNNPVLWPQWARTVSFVVDDAIGNRIVEELVAVSTSKDINGGVISQNVTVIDKTPERIVNLVVAPTETLGPIPPATLDVWDPVSEELDFEIRPECKNPVMVVWTNQLAGLDQWLFDVGQTIQIDYEKGLIFERPITQDIEFVDRTKGRQVRFSSQKVKLFAENLLFDQAVALANIKASSSIFIWLDRTGLTFVQAVFSGNLVSSFRTKPEGKSYSIELELELPDNFLLNTKGERVVGGTSNVTFP